tara:strand:- start:91 stop:1002 length:912 start_codon:yes stop_codon:yes gene_type:complete
MAFSVTQPNFNGKAAGFFISAALKEATSLEYLTMIENIKYKSNVQTMAGSNLVVDNACNYVSAGNLALEEKTLEPKRLMLNLDICKEELATSWEALQMRAGVDGNPSVTFEDYVISYLGEIIANATEDSIWSGTAVAGQFNGFLGLVTGLLLPGPDPTVVQDAAVAAPYTAGNIISNLQGAVAAIPTTTLGKEDLHIYMSQRTYQYYIGAVSTLGYVNAYQMNGDYVPMFEGYKLAVCSGMEENQLVVAQKSNMFFGTDLLSDSTRISLLDMNPVNGSDVIRCVARYSAGVQTGIGADIVRQS